MRAKLLSTAAILALSLSAPLAFAQERSPAGSGAQKFATPEKSPAGAAHSAEQKSGAQTGAETSKEKSSSAERGSSAHSASEQRAGEEHKASESKPSESRSPENRAAETKGQEHKPTGTQTGEAERRNETKSGEHKSDQKTGEAKPSTSSTSEKGNAAAEQKNSTSGSHNQSEPGKASAEGATTRTGDQKRATAPSGSSAAPSPNSAGSQTNPAGTAGANQTGNNAGTNRTGTAGSANTTSGERGNVGTQTNVNASTNIAPQQQSKIVDTLRSRHTEAETNVNFSVSVGVTVPENVHYRPLPEDIVSIVPQYRGYDYVMVHDEVVILEPRTRKIVTVIHEGGSSASSARRTSLSIPVEKRRKIRTEVIRSYHGPKDVHVDLRVGERVPETVTLERFPNEIYSEDADLRSYEYVVVQEDVVLVDPQTREIVEILQ